MKFLPLRIPGYDPFEIIGDATAGLTVGLIIIPQAFLHAALAEVPIEYTIYSALFGTVLYPFLGRNKNVIISSTHVLLGLISIYTRNDLEWIPQKAVLLTFMCGVSIFLAAVLSAGWLVNRLSSYVLAGFIWANVLIIVTMELHHMVGIDYVNPDNFRFIFLLFHLNEARPWDIALSICCIILLPFFGALRNIRISPENTKPRTVHKIVEGTLTFVSNISGALVLVIATAVTYHLYDSDKLFTLAGPVNFKERFPTVALPPLSAVTITEPDWRVTFMTPLLVPLMAILSHASVIRAFSDGEEALTGWELSSVGIINLMGSFFFCVPLAADFSCSSINTYYGARSRLSGFFAGLVVVLYVSGVTVSFHSFVPRAAVSCIIVFTLFHLARGITLAALRDNNRARIVGGITTFLVGIFLSVEYGVIIGILLDITICAFMSQKVPVITEKLQSPAGISYILVTSSVDTKLPTVKMFEEAIERNAVLTQDNVKHMPVVIDCKYITFANLNAANGVYLLMEFFRDMKTTVIFHNLNADVAKAFSSVFPADFLHSPSDIQLRRLFRAMRIESEKSKLRNGKLDPESQIQEGSQILEDTNC